MQTHEHWSSRLTFLFAAVGAAIGLGNIWKFPYTAGVSGGGAFVLVYIAAVVLVAIPILIAELMIGRCGQESPPRAMAKLAKETGSHPAWQGVGWLGVITAFIILSFYSVIGGWIMAYVPKFLDGTFTNIGQVQAETIFGNLLADPVMLIVWQTVFIVATAFIIAGGVHRGIEKAVGIMLPALFVMLIGVIIYAAVEGDMASALKFLFQPDFSRITPQIVLMAVGQAFFSIGVGMAIMMTYGSYLGNDVSLTRSALVIAGADTLAAILAGLAIFPLVFGNHLDPGEGPGLILVTLPMAFGHMTGGAVFGAIFFILIIFAALTSSISILEPIVAWSEERKGISRVRATTFWGVIVWLTGLASVFSFNIWAGVRPLGWIHAYADKSIFDLMDHFTSNLMLPLAGLLAALFVGWRFSRATLEAELPMIPPSLISLFVFLLRFLVPVCLAALIITGIA